MGHGLLAAFSAALLVPSSGWIKTGDEYPDNYLDLIRVVYNGVYSFTNTGSSTVEHNVGGQDSRSRTVAGSALEGPPTENGPTWGAKFTPRSDSPLLTNWEVAWIVEPGWTWYLNIKYDHEVGAEQWYRSGTGFAKRTRSWHTFVETTETKIGPGNGGPGGGG